MKIVYSGKDEEFTPQQREKFETKLNKLSKMLERDGERETRVVLSQERFLHKVEVTVHAWDHELVGIGSDGDLLTSMSEALDKLEKQVVRLREKWRATHRHFDKEAVNSAASSGPDVAVNGRNKPKIFRVKAHDERKPMTLEEALMEMDDVKDYMVYRDLKTERLSVLLRRPDGNYDLIES